MRATLRVGLALAALSLASGMTIGAGSGGAAFDALRLPLRFESREQPPSEQEFVARGPGYAVVLTPGSIRLRLQGEAEALETRRSSNQPCGPVQDPSWSDVRLSLVGANPSARVIGTDELPGKVNDFRGNDSTQWRRNVPTFAKVRCEQVYPGIDLVYYGTTQRELEFDFVVRAGADAMSIALAIAGADQVEKDLEGNLVLRTASGEALLHAPAAYQLLDGIRREVACDYVLEDACTWESGGAGAVRDRHSQLNVEPSRSLRITLAFGSYDATKPLVVDPVLSYSTYLGGGRTGEGYNFEWAGDIAVDAEGNVYLTGTTSSPNFPVIDPAQPTLGGSDAWNLNAFVVKLGPGGSNLVYATYLGGAGQTQGTGIAIDAEGSAYVTGWDWGGSGFPLVNPLPVEHGGKSQAFVTKLNPAGNALVYSSLLGGSLSPTGASAGNRGHKIAVDLAGNAYVTGWTEATNFPTVNALQPAYGGGAQDSFVVKLNAPGNALLYSTYLGGDASESPSGVCADPAGNAYVAGSTESTNFPTTPNSLQPAFRGGDSDGFICKIDPTGSSLVYSTYLGGESWDMIQGLDLDGKGQVHVMGETTSTNFPTTSAAFEPVSKEFRLFVTKLSAEGSTLLYSTYVPGAHAGDLAVDGAGCAYVVGNASWHGSDPRGDYWRQPRNAVQSNHGGGWYDAWALKLDADGSELVYATFLGGSEVDSAVAVAVDSAGNAYVAGHTPSTNFPIVNPLQGTNGGGHDVFVAKIAPDPDTTPPRLVAAYTHDDPGVVNVVFSESIAEASATNAANYSIDHGVAVIAAAMGANSKRVRLTVSPLPADLACSLTVNNVQDRALSVANRIAPDSQIRIITTQGRISRKEFWNIPCALLSALTNSARFPDDSDLLDYPPTLELPLESRARNGVGYQPPPIDPSIDFFSVDMRDNYGVQFQGYVTPPATGDYTFYLCSDGQGALWLSSDDKPANQRLIASEPQGNPPRQWVNGVNQSSRGNPPQNISPPIPLVAGQRYYLEALMSENVGGDNLAVTWRKPGDPEIANGAAPISQEYLSAFTTSGTVTITNQPASLTVDERQDAVFRVGVDGTPPYYFQWLKNGAPVPGATNSVLTVSAAAVADDGTAFSVTVSNLFSAVTSSGAVLKVTPDTTPPTLAAAEGNLNLNKITLTFSEPIRPEDATNAANYALSGGLEVMGASLRLDRRTVVLTTTPQTEGNLYTLTVNGIRDLAVAANDVPTNSQITFIAWMAEEFVGPFPSWADAKRDFGAVGDGIADDTDALQRALDSIGWSGTGQWALDRPHVLYVPAGTYRITQTLRFKYRISVSLLGEDPAMTILVWDGPADQPMLHCNGVAYHKVSRLTFDGRGHALSAVNHKWDGTNQPHATSGSEYSDLIIRDVAYGIRAGVANNDAEVVVLRCRFLRCSGAGISMESYNALDWFAWYCEFDECRVGVTEGYAGACHVYCCLFRDSIETDTRIGNCVGYFSYRHNTSVNSRAFFAADGFTMCPGNVTLQGNTIIDPRDSCPIRLGDPGPILVLDNTIRSRAEVQSGPVVGVWNNLVSVGNTCTVQPPVRAWARALSLDDRLVARDTLDLEVPELPGPLPNRHRPVIEVRSGATATEIQQAIDQANQLRGQRPVVHLPVGSYSIQRTLVIPAGCDVQLVGDGYIYSTMLEWTGEGAGPVLRLEGPSRATLRELSIHGSDRVDGVVVDNCDQPGARVFMEQAAVGGGQHGLIVDRLDHTDVSLNDFYHGATDSVSVQVIGGPGCSQGAGVEGRVAVFGGGSGGSALAYDVLHGGSLLVQDMWYEGAPPPFMRLTGAGTFTLHGAVVGLSERPGVPAVELDGFHGAATFLTCAVGNTPQGFVVSPASPDANLLLMGVIGFGQDYLVNLSDTARVGRIASDGATPDGSSIDVPDQGDASPAFVRQMLAQTRTQKPRLLWPQPAGVTDVRLFRVRASNGRVSIKLTGSNAPPTLAPAPVLVIDEGRTLLWTNEVSDPDLPFNTLTFRLLPGAPAGVSLNPTNGTFSWIPTERDGPSTNRVGVSVTDDGSPPLSATNFVTVIVSEVNAAPVLASIADRTVDEHQALVFTVTASDPDDVPANNITLSVGDLPEGATFDPTAGRFAWTPSEAQGPGTYAVTFTATDDGVPPLSRSETITLTVREVNDPPLAQPLTLSTDEDTPVSIVLAATDPENTPLSFVVVTPPSHGTLKGTLPNLIYRPATNYHGADLFTFKVSDGTLESAQAPVSVTVRSVNDPPTITLMGPAANAQFIAPATIELEAEARDVDGPIAQVEFFAGTTKLGESVEAPFVWTWTDAVAGSHVLSAKATDHEGGEALSEEVTVSVLASLRSAELLADGSFRFRLAGEPGCLYVIEVSEDLHQWTPWQTNAVDATGWLVVNEPVTPGPSERYYRARAGP